MSRGLGRSSHEIKFLEEQEKKSKKEMKKMALMVAL
jgi:hypothetical protein